MDSPRSLNDRYQLTAHLARGGMADVYQGLDGLLGRKVAVKVLHSQFSSDDAFVRRFRKEAQAAANLTHPNIVGIYDWGQFDSTYYIVMELIEGRSLREVLRSEGALLPRRAVEIAIEVAAALSVAHRAGLVHRDIKPGNILLAPDGTVKVTDFGIARAWDDSQELTRTGAVMGTATYFSPEQAQGERVDERSDVYSLGVVLYEMLTGTPPFRGDSPVSVAYQHVSADAAPPSSLNPDVTPALDAIVLRAMSKVPQDRYQSAEDLRVDLWRVLQGETPSVVTQSQDEAPTQMMATPTPPATVPPTEIYRQLEEPPASNTAFVVGAFALLATLAVLVFLVFRLLGGSDQVAAPELIAVPDVTNFEEAEALRTIQLAGLNVDLERVEDADVEAGRVIRTDPPPNTEVEPDTTVRVYVSEGVEQLAVPYLIGLRQDSAEELIRREGFTVGNVEPRADADQPAGVVIAQSPSANERFVEGTPIDIVISSGPESVILGNLEGRTEREAKAELEALNLRWEVFQEFSDEVEADRVIRTEPGPGAELIPGDTVDLYISEGPEPVEVPDLFGLTIEAAQTRLDELGLILEQSNATLETNDPALVGRIVDQNPDAGITLNPGDIVLVTLGVPPPTTTTVPDETTTTTEAP